MPGLVFLMKHYTVKSMVTEWFGHKGVALKNDLWAIARSTYIPKWQHNLDKMKADGTTTYEWVEELGPSTWIKAFSVIFLIVLCYQLNNDS